MISKEIFLKRFKKILELHDETNEILENFKKIGLELNDSPIVKLWHKCENELLETLSNDIDNYSGEESWCYWYVYYVYNKKPLKAYMLNKEFLIETPEDLYKLLKEEFDKKN